MVIYSQVTYQDDNKINHNKHLSRWIKLCIKVM